MSLDTFFDYQNKLGILQWNIRGMQVNHNFLDELIFKYQPDIICLQEIRVPYNIPPHVFWATHIPYVYGYEAITDPIYKTALFYKSDLKVTELPQKLWYTQTGTSEYKALNTTQFNKLTNIEKKNVVYIKYAAIETTFKNGFHKEKETIVIGNLYNSPNGISSSDIVFEQTDIINKELQKLHINNSNTKFVFLGDWNACHSAWGSPITDNYDKRIKEGKKLVAAMENNDFTVISEGKATRFVYDINRQRVKYSHLDFAAVSGFKRDRIIPHTIQLDMGSDHYPILYNVNTATERFEQVEIKTKWNFTPTTDWDKYETLLTRLWEDLQTKLTQKIRKIC